MSHKVNLPNGEVLTGWSWRRDRDNAIFINLPFVSSLVHAEGNMGDALGPMLDLAKVNGRIKSDLMVCKKRFLLDFLI
jgi:hypothetical protein